MTGVMNRDFWTCGSFVDFVVSATLGEPRSADFVAKAALGEARSADFVVSTILAESRNVDFMASAALGAPQSSQQAPYLINLEMQILWHIKCKFRGKCNA